MKRFFLATVLICCFTCQSNAKCRLGDIVFANKEYKLAIDNYELCKSRGDAYAKYQLGRIFYQGLGVEQDFSIATKHFHEAAEQNFHLAQQKLGIIFWRGDGVIKDKIRAYKWLTLASDGNDKKSTELLNQLILKLNKKEIIEGDKRVMLWRIKTADGGHAAISARLGLVYWKGENVVEKNPVKAYKWLQLSAEQGDPVGIRLRDEILKRMNEKQQREGKALVEKWKKEHLKK